MNIYISNLNFATKNDSLQNLFAAYGEVSSANIITDRETGRSRGFGFVTFVSKADYDKCLESGTIPGDGFEIQCSPISLSKSEDRYRRSRK